MAASKVRIGVIGTGFARRTQLPILTALSSVQVRAITSGHPENARRAAVEFGIPEVVESWQDLVARDDLDLIVVSTPPHLHHPIALAALHHGKHVLCEKPLALNASEAEEMAVTAEAARVLHVVDHELRFDPNRARLRHLAGEGYCGRIFYIRAHWSYDRAAGVQTWDWWSDDEKGGGVLGAIGSHVIDLMRWSFGEVAAVGASLNTFVAERNDPVTGKRRAVASDDYAALLLQLLPPSGPPIEATVTLSAVGPERSELWQVVGDRGTLTIATDGKLLGSRNGETEDLSEPSGLPRGLAVKESAWACGFHHLATAMVRAVRTGETEVADAATFRDGWRVQQILDAAHIAASEGRFLGTGAWRPAMA